MRVTILMLKAFLEKLQPLDDVSTCLHENWQSTTTVFNQPACWNFRWLPNTLSHFACPSRWLSSPYFEHTQKSEDLFLIRVLTLIYSRPCSTILPWSASVAVRKVSGRWLVANAKLALTSLVDDLLAAEILVPEHVTSVHMLNFFSWEPINTPGVHLAIDIVHLWGSYC
jgi:hypothetical protein